MRTVSFASDDARELGRIVGCFSQKLGWVLQALVRSGWRLTDKTWYGATVRTGEDGVTAAALQGRDGTRAEMWRVGKTCFAKLEQDELPILAGLVQVMRRVRGGAVLPVRVGAGDVMTVKAATAVAALAMATAGTRAAGQEGIIADMARDGLI